DNTEAMFKLAILYHLEFKDFKNAEKYYLMATEKDSPEAMFGLALLYNSEFKDYKNAEKYYLMAVEKDNLEAMVKLAILYHSEFKDFKNAEKYYLMAIEKDNTEAMFKLAILYHLEFKDFKNAEKYYLMAVEKEHPSAMNSLAWMFFEHRLDPKNALKYAQKLIKLNPSIYTYHTAAMIHLWNDEIEKSLQLFKAFLEDKDAFKKFSKDINDYLILLIAKKQYHATYRLFNENPHHLKDRYKPTYYALMSFMKDTHPLEYRRMGSDLKETVDEIIAKINQWAIDYK
ncbi:MAG: sel1 repeat family protein, partial [Candidatus Marinimicrobia bacterium]|nr:sel1 repeat family protein [Candidatus Neomarinimicrobiota bacterium]